MCKKILMSILLVFTLLSFSCQMAGGDSEVDSAHSDWNTIEAFGEFVRVVDSSIEQSTSFPFSSNYLTARPTVGGDVDAYVIQYYQHWREKYVFPAPVTSGAYYVAADATGPSSPVEIITQSEAHGYGMLITAMMPDGITIHGSPENIRSTFDGLVLLYDKHRSIYNNSFMAWGVAIDEKPLKDLNGNLIGTSATDGDLDIAYALLLAHDRWGSNGDVDYLGKARDIIAAIESTLISSTSPRILTMGDWVKANLSSNKYQMEDTRPSDWMPSHLRVFGDAVNSTVLSNDVVDGIYSYYSTIRNQTESIFSTATVKDYTGLMPDFVDYQWGSIRPASPNFLEAEYDSYYAENAIRVPWRFALDAALFNEVRAENALNEMLAFVTDSRAEKFIPPVSNPEWYKWAPSGLYYYYNLDGSIPAYIYNEPPYDDSTWTTEAKTYAPFAAAAAAVGGHQTQLNRWWLLMNTPNHPNGVAQTYYPETISMLCQIFISEHWGVPGPIQTPQPLRPVSSVAYDVDQTVIMNSPNYDRIEHCYDEDLTTLFGMVNRPHINNDPWLILQYPHGKTITSVEIEWFDVCYATDYVVSIRDSTINLPDGENWGNNWTVVSNGDGNTDTIYFGNGISADQFGMIMRTSFANNGGNLSKAYFGILEITAYGY